MQEKFVTIRDNESNSSIEGSQFFEKNFMKGEVIENNKKLLDAFLRYNVVKEQVEIKLAKKDTAVFVLPRLNSFTYDFGKYRYILKNFSTKEGEVLLGYSIIYFESDNYIFLSKPFVRVRPEQKAETSYGRTRPAQYRVRNKFYFGVNGKPLEEIKIKERTFKEVLPITKEIEGYYDDHRINKVDEVVELLKFNEKVSSAHTGL